LVPAQLKYEALYEKCKDPLTVTKELLILFRIAWKEYRELLMELVKLLKLTPGVPKELLASAGIAMAISGPHNDKKPEGRPELIFDLSVEKEITVLFGPKPAGVHEVEILIKKGGQPPVEVTEFDRSDSYTTSPRTYEYEEKDRFEIVYFMARYKSETGIPGSWTRTYKVSIP
jgi:hypothetical protein